jgi:mycothiol maleylpyruvate isomerase-like protein
MTIARTLTGVRQAYSQAARAAASLLAHPAIASSWDQPSALERYAVSGLAGHLAGQIFFAENALARPEPNIEPISLWEYYDRVAWIRSGPDGDPHVRIRRGSEMLAADGAAALVARTDAAVARLPELLAATPVPRLVQLPSWEWALTFDDFLRSRLIELTVHIDDLAVSVDLPIPTLPPQITEPVLDVLTKLATRTHGVAAVLRALTRSERAPASIAAF